MVRNVKVRKMGGSIGATLPSDFADRFHLKAGDDLTVIETADGILLTPFDPDVSDALELGAALQARYRNALRELAK